MTRKKILIISNMYPSVKYPHYGVFVQNIAQILSMEGACINVVTLKKYDYLISKLIGYVAFYIKIIYTYIFSKADVVYVHYASHCGLPILIADKIKKRKLVVNVHGNDLVPETDADKKFKKIVQHLLNKAELVICPSVYFQQILKDEFEIEKTLVYPSGGVDIDKFCHIERCIAYKQLGLSDSYKYIGYVSRIEINKGWDIFLKACAPVLQRHQEIRLIVVGSGSEKELYTELKNKLDIADKIIEYPFLSQNELVYVYNALDLFIFPTQRKSESLGLVGLEAMACQTLTILPDRYGPVSYERDGINAFVFESGNVESLEQIIEKGLSGEYENMSIEARNTALKYSSANTEWIIREAFNKL